MKHSGKRVRILKQSGRKSAAQESLQQHVLRFPQRNMTYVSELKQLASKEQWQERLAQLFQNETTRRLRRELQLSEGMLEQMMTELEVGHNPYEMEQYEKELRKVFPVRIRDLLLKQPDMQVRITSSHDAYARMARVLKHL